MHQKAALIVAMLSTPLFSASAATKADFLVQRYSVYINHNKVGILQNTIKQLNTGTGHAIITAVSVLLGGSSTALNGGIALAAKFAVPRGRIQDTRGLIRSPTGYTICYASPTNIGARNRGIETHGDSTFNTTLYRVVSGKSNDDGLGWYMSIPYKVSTDVRVSGSFDVVWVQAIPGWQQKYKRCRPTFSHPWLARNNETRLDAAR